MPKSKAPYYEARLRHVADKREVRVRFEDGERLRSVDGFDGLHSFDELTLYKAVFEDDRSVYELIDVKIKR